MGRHNAFTFPFTFFRESPEKVIPELQEVGFTGINLALNYHASRDFLLRQGPALEYLADGFHYYKPDLHKYPSTAIKPETTDALVDSSLLEQVIKVAEKYDFEIHAWAVFMHNSAIGFRHPDATVTNCFGNHFLSELCPSSESISGYISGLSSDLASRGITSIAIESLHFHGAHHGEHHERFFLEMSEITAFLFSLCFCTACKEKFTGDGEKLQSKVATALKPFLEDCDPWLGKILTEDALAEIVGPEIRDYLRSRENTLTKRYRQVRDEVSEYHVKTKFVDQAPLLTNSESTPLNHSWRAGIDNESIRQIVDIYEPLIYRTSVRDVQEVGAHYRSQLGGSITGILRPTHPDNGSERELIEKVSALKEVGITEIDFYLLDAMRPRDLGWVKRAITS